MMCDPGLSVEWLRSLQKFETQMERFLNGQQYARAKLSLACAHFKELVVGATAQSCAEMVASPTFLPLVD